MKILHTEWSDGWGGQEIRIVSEMEALRDRGVELLLATREESKIKEEAEKKGFKVYSLPFRGNLDVKTVFKLIKIIKKEKVDILNTHSGKDTWVGGIAAKLSGIKFIRTRHLSNRINPSRTNFINELADFIITTGESVKNDMIKFNRINPNKIESIPTGVDEKIFNPENYDRESIRKEFGVDKEEIVIGILGVLRRVKGHELFLEMAEKISKKYKNLKFLIAGDGPLKEDIQKKIIELELDNVELLGYVDAGRFLSAIDILVSTSKNEGVPQSIIQALMMKKAIVATDVGSVKDLFYNDNFILTPSMDLEKLVDNVEFLLSKDNRKLFESKEREFILNNFSKKSMGEKVLNIYKDLLK